MELSARNQLKGRVVRVKSGGVMAEVEVEVEPGNVVAPSPKVHALPTIDGRAALRRLQRGHLMNQPGPRNELVGDAEKRGMYSFVGSSAGFAPVGGL